MSLAQIAKRARLKVDLTKEDIPGLLFPHRKTVRACGLFLEYLRKNGHLTPREVSRFGYDLQEARIRRGFSYRRESFYRVILRRLADLGFIQLRSYYQNKPREYWPVTQPIPKKAPGGHNFYNLAWKIASLWNEYFKGSTPGP